eukprot:TRINITY_DN4449_c0_g1_i1.p1 TRINITY_DN4449_c0_g1~~TRINITY_DN4449_c0_g1_i1.p1  ORF type:complete len:461 (+),score=126.02 TRINITY_DN4449_c0_g1_i1:84-1466(+)
MEQNTNSANDKSKLLKQLVQDVEQLKPQLKTQNERAEKMFAWLNTNFPLALEEVRTFLAQALFPVQTKIVQLEQKQQDLNNLLKTAVGNNGEIIKQLFDERAAETTLTQDEAAKSREETLWNVFKNKMDAITSNFNDWEEDMNNEKDNIGKEINLMKTELEKLQQERLLAEESKKKLLERYNALEKESREKPVREAEHVKSLLSELERERDDFIQSGIRVEQEYDLVVRHIQDEKIRIEAKQDLNQEKTKIEFYQRQLDYQKQQIGLSELRLEMREQRRGLLDERRNLEKEISLMRNKELEERKKIEQDFARKSKELEEQKAIFQEENARRKRILDQQDQDLKALEDKIHNLKMAEIISRTERDTFNSRLQPKGPITVQNKESSKPSPPIGNRVAVSSWLNENGFSSYIDRFFACGYERLQEVSMLDETDLDLLEIKSAQHREQLLRASVRLRESLQGKV